MSGVRPDLRRALRRRRADLSPAERRAATAAVNRRLAAHPLFRNARTIALYSASGAELDVWPLIRTALAARKRVYLPRVAGGRMHFVPYTPASPMRRGAFGIVEPRRLRRPARRLGLDLIVAPLVGFDERGNRLGQGGGYYDRALAARNATSLRRPLLLGVAFDVQRCAALDVEPWDVGCDFVQTERAFYRF